MDIQPLSHFFKDTRKVFFSLACSLSVLIMLNIFLDYWFTRLQNSAFYFSESLLFSSFWILFVPLLWAQLYITKKTKNIKEGLGTVLAASLIHLAVYPLLIWLLSKTFYDHTFPYGQTFNFGVTAYLIKSVMIYTSSFILFTLIKNKTRENHQPSNETIPERTTTSMVVSDTNNRKVVIEVQDVFYFSANPPYINIHHRSKKYLHPETLKSLEAQLDSSWFVRIHKSHIVNIHRISSYRSRQNGDFDITLSDQTVLRVSRNYAKELMSKMNNLHLTSK